MFLDRNSVPFAGANNYHIHTSEFRTGEFYPEHWHAFHEFFLVVRGELEHRLNGKRFLLPEGTVQLIHPGDHHELHPAPGCPDVKIYNCNVLSDEIVKVLAFLTGGHDFSLDDCVQSVRLPVDSPIWKYLVAEAGKAHDKTLNQQLRTVIMRHLTETVFLTLMQCSDYSAVAVPQWLGDSCREMRKKENYKLGLSRFIRLAGRSQEHLCRSMRRYYGISPQDYVLELRLDEAVHLLLNSGLDISTTAYGVGFNNLSYFRRCFRKRFGMSPVQYKKMRKSRCGVLPPSAALEKETPEKNQSIGASAAFTVN